MVCGFRHFPIKAAKPFGTEGRHAVELPGNPGADIGAVF
jgi:hypothetical protein